MPKFLKYSAIIFAFIIIILLIVPFFISLDSYKELAISKVRETTGRELKINGPLSLSLIPCPTIKIKDVSLSSIAGAKYDSLLKANEISASVSILSLLRGRVDISSIGITDPIINLERVENGSASWEFSKTNLKTTTASEQINDDNNKASMELFIDLIKIANAQLNYLDATNKNNSPVTFSVDNLEIKNLHGPDNISAEIYSSGKNYNIEGNIHEKEGVITIKNNLELFKEKIIISGDLTRDNMSFIGKVNVQGNAKNLQDIFPNVKILNKADHTITFDISGNQKLLSFNNISLTSGKIAGNGNASFSPLDGKIKLQMKLNPGDIDFAINSAADNANTGNSNKLSLKANSIKPLLDELAIDTKAIPASLLNQSFSFITDLLYQDQNLLLNNMNLAINKATLKGDLGIKDWNKNISANYNLQIDQPQIFANLFAVSLPSNLNNLSVKGQSTKEQDLIKTNSTFIIAGASSNIKGTIGLGKSIKPNLTIESTGNSLGKLVGQLTKSSANDALGNYSLLAKIEGDTAQTVKVDINKFSVNLKNSPMSLSAVINTNLAPTTPKISADAKVGSINLNNISGNSGGGSSGQSSPASYSNNSPARSNGKIDLAFLKKFDGNINLNIQQIIKGDLVFDAVQTKVALLNGNLDIKSLQGKVFGGALDANGQISADGPISFKANLQGANLKNIIKQKGKIKIVSGVVNFVMDIKTTGQSQMQYVKNLFGSANLSAHSGAIAGFDLQKIFNFTKNIKNPAEILRVFDEAFSGGDTQFENLTLSTEIKNGIAIIKSSKLQAGQISATASGSFNLPSYSCDINADIALDSKNSYPPFTVRFYGSLNNIQHKIALEALQQYLIKKVVGGIIQGQKPGDILKNIIGNKNSAEEGEDKSNDKVNDLIGKGVKGLLNKLSN